MLLLLLLFVLWLKLNYWLVQRSRFTTITNAGFTSQIESDLLHLAVFPFPKSDQEYYTLQTEGAGECVATTKEEAREKEG